MLDSRADGIPGLIGNDRLRSSGPEESGYSSQTFSRSRSRSLRTVGTVHGNVDSNAVKSLMSNADQIVAWFLYFYRMVAAIMLRRLCPSVATAFQL